MTQDFILKKSVDWSLFQRGFSIPVEMQNILALHLSAGFLRHGEKRNIKIILNGETFDATLTSVNFNRQKYPDHNKKSSRRFQRPRLHQKNYFAV